MTSESACLSLPTAVGFCLATAAAFVGSLYIIVPSRVRTLDRNHPSQIKWRSCATGLVCLGAYTGSQYLVCNKSDNAGSMETNLSPFSLHTFSVSSKVLAHVAVLYTGSIVQGTSLVGVYMRRQSNFSLVGYIKSLYGYHLEPTLRSLSFQDDQGWITWRNLAIAPTLEEVAFRTCMVPVLLATGLHANTVCWTAPLFFGVAHFHHAFQKLREEGTRPTSVAVQTLFQFAYTTLFGAYATYVYIHTQSTVAVALVHGFCNWMGLPNFLFFQQKHVLHDYRHALLAAHVIGSACFGTSLFRGFLHYS
eukprot:scaffold18039_cov166-Amphora_coffeaeformis.AAC.3